MKRLGVILLVIVTAIALAIPLAVPVAAAVVTDTIVSDGTTEYWSWGADATWGTGDDGWALAVPCWTHPSWVSIAPAGATWIWTSYQIVPATEYNTLPPEGYRTFRKEFDIPSGVYNITGSISINADNAYVLLVNGVVVDSEGAMDNPLIGPDNHEWNTLRTTALTNLVVGTNTIEVHALNYFNTGSGTSNPAALVFSLTAQYEELENFVTGGGNIKDGRKVAWTFGGNVGFLESGDIVGQFQIVDHVNNESWHCHNDFSFLEFTGDPIDGPPGPDASHNHATFIGTFTSNRGNELILKVDIWDIYEPGKDNDVIKVQYWDEGLGDFVDWFGVGPEEGISGGNFQIHNVSAPTPPPPTTTSPPG